MSDAQRIAAHKGLALAERNEPANDFPSLPPNLQRLRVAIVHYWFIGRAGGEQVVEALAAIFPQADIFALIAKPEEMDSTLRSRKLTTSFLNKIPLVHRFHRHTLLLQPIALEQFDLSGYDLVLSSESGPAKGVITSPRTLHVCYCHSPMRYIWDMYPSYVSRMGRITGLIFGLTAHHLRLWDVATANRVDAFIANSRFVCSRIQKFYGRHATVIHPPVQISEVETPAEPEDFYLAIGRLVDYKRFDLAVEACSRLGRKLKIIGAGPEYKNLKSIAGPTVEFLGAVSDEDKRNLLAHCRALLFCGEEDFGMVPVEAQAQGRPVIGFGSGGLLETTVPFKSGHALSNATGILFKEQTVAAVMNAMQQFEENIDSFDAEHIRSHAQQFGPMIFRQKMISFLSTAIEEHRTSTFQKR